MPGSIGTPTEWAVFIGVVLVMLALDLGVFHRKSHAVSFKEAAVWSAVWVGLALAFSAWIYVSHGTTAGTEFLTGYVIEKSLSVDNIFVFVMIFAALRIPDVHQHRVLYWGILSALVLRAVLIFAGAAAVARFHWLLYVFGGFLVLTGAKMLWSIRKADGGEAEGPPKLLGWLRKVIPTTERLDGARFFTRETTADGRVRRVGTPLLLALVLVELSDVLFAVDSIPAIFAITTDPFIVFTSNIFAILGLRSLYFLLAGLVDRFRYLKHGLAALLVVVGVKMLVADVVKVPPALSLAVIAAILGAAVWASLAATRREQAPAGSRDAAA
ncbi:MAG: TerC family protein [Myxococcales bacterium]|nr:TerC family protein [Myxococcales bacterium]MCB9734936.1 TerC family protein [Deltaproteobacteria bacterium]